MSLKSFLTKIWKEIRNLFADIPVELKTAIHMGVIVAENIKTFINSPATDIITALIPGDADDKIKDTLRSKIPLILSELKLADDCQNITDPAELITCAVNTLQNLEGDVKSSFLHAISILAAQAVADRQLTWSDGVYLLEWYYQHKYKAD